MSSVIQIMAEKFNRITYSLIRNQELRFERSGLLREVAGEDRSLKFGDGKDLVFAIFKTAKGILLEYQVFTTQVMEKNISEYLPVLFFPHYFFILVTIPISEKGSWTLYMSHFFFF